MFFNFPEAVVEGEFLCGSFFEFFEDEVLSQAGEDSAIFGVLQVDDVVLNEGVVDDIVDVQFEAPGHGCFFFAGEIDEMGDYFVYV